MPSIDSGGVPIYYRERGPVKGTPLVLLMGLGADGSVWEDHVKVYEARFRCIMIDNRGSGGSGKPEGPYTTLQMAQDTITVMNALDLGRAHVAGISMGSTIAQHVALLAPERVRSLTLNCPWQKVDVFAGRTFEVLRSAYGVMNASDFQKLLQLIIFTPAYHEKHLDDLLAGQQAAADNEQRMPVHAFQAQCDACLSHDTIGQLHKITAPTLITVGERDVFTPPHLSHAIASEIPHVELVLFEGSGHTHHWDRLLDFNQLTLDFMLKQEEHCHES